MARIPARRRPRYAPVDRLAILELKASRGWNEQQAASAFLISPATVAGWLRRVDEKGPEALVQAAVRIAQLLARAGLILAVSTVGRMMKRPSATPPPPAGDVESKADRAGTVRTVTAKYPGHVWNVDLTTVPISGGFWVPWIPRALAQSWPLCGWVGFILDHFSRRVVGFSVFAKEPTAEQICEMLDGAVERVGQAPKYTVTDQGPQFWAENGSWCRQHGVKPRYGAVGEHGSIAVIERFFLTPKTEAMRVIAVPFSLEAMRAELVAFVRW